MTTRFSDIEMAATVTAAEPTEYCEVCIPPVSGAVHLPPATVRPKEFHVVTLLDGQYWRWGVCSDHLAAFLHTLWSGQLVVTYSKVPAPDLNGFNGGPPVEAEGQWVCPLCDYVNEVSDQACGDCGHPR